MRELKFGTFQGLVYSGALGLKVEEAKQSIGMFRVRFGKSLSQLGRKPSYR